MSAAQKVVVARDPEVELRESGLTINHAKKTFISAEGKEVHAIDDVSLAIHKGEFFILLGPSGCGKTTLLRSIAGLESLDAGEIYLGDQRIDPLPPYDRPVNTVFQSYALFPHMTVAQNVAFGLEMEKKPKDEITKTVQEMLDLVHLGDFGGRKPSQMSGGQQQRVGLARAFVARPEVVFADEPTGNLDSKTKADVMSMICGFARDLNQTIVLVTHDPQMADYADRIVTLLDGRIIDDQPHISCATVGMGSAGAPAKGAA